MLRNRIFSLVLLAACIICAGSVAAVEVDSDQIYCFEPDSFADGDLLTGICLTELPDPSTGTVMLGTRVLRSGDILAADQISQMTFQPLRTEQDTEAQVTYLPIYEDRVDVATTMTIAIRGKEDKAPVAEDSAVETYKNLPNTGKLKATDPEGETLTYTLIRQPKRGTVTINQDSTFTYTPKKNKVGTDSFTFTATDPAGKVSREATVTIQILKPENATQYTDTIGKECRFSAEWMKNTGLFVGEQVGGQNCFQPEKAVSRGEFLTMLVKTLDISTDDKSTQTGFTDDAPGWLKPYLAAALRSGLTTDWPHGEVFGASEPITGAEAALLMQNALDLPSSIPSGKEDDEELPVWAMEALAAMSDQGIQLDAQPLTRGQAAQVLYQVSKLPVGDVY